MQKTILIASYLEPELVEQIRAADSRVDVLYAPELVAPPRYPADHKGADFTRTAAQEAEWRGMLARADILFDFDRSSGRDLASRAPNVRWVQATSAGIGEYIAKMGYRSSMPDTVFTTASGVHAQPLAEFCFMVMFAFHKKLLMSLRDQAQKKWERFAAADLAEQTLVIVGVGRVGAEVARLGKALGMRVIGVKRDTGAANAQELHLDQLVGPAQLHDVLPHAQNLVLITPHTQQTEKMIGGRELALLPAGAVFINIGRGPVVDEPALIASLQSGHLLGAGLDVFETEPLPIDSPLWEMDNVIICPHSASTSTRENARITDLFCVNLRLFLDGKPLRNQFNHAAGY